jgi:hypothetical protein
MMHVPIGIGEGERKGERLVDKSRDLSILQPCKFISMQFHHNFRIGSTFNLKIRETVRSDSAPSV